MKKWVKRTVSIVTAGAMIAGSVYLFDLHYLQHVEAKETLESIKKVVAETTQDAPYTILEVVPDVSVSKDVEIEDFRGQVYKISSLAQSMGVIGYYVGGQEPSVADAAEKFTELQCYDADPTILTKGLNDTALRKSYIEKVTEPLKTAHVVTDDPAKTDYPIYYEGYKEYSEADYNLTEDVKAKIADGTYPLIPFNYTGENGEAQHLDRMHGYMVNTPDGSGKLIYRYIRVPETDPPADPPTDFALRFLNESDTSEKNFKKVSDSSGELDPHFIHPEGASPNYYAKFGKSTGSKRGYVIESAQIWDQNHLGDPGTPVYVAITPESVSGNAVGAELSYAGKVKDDNGSKVIVNDAGDTISGEGENPLFMPIFTYTESPADGAVLYQVIDYKLSSKDYVNQYNLDTETPLVSNMTCTGTVKVGTYYDWEGMTDANLVYDYLPNGGGNYNFTTNPEAGEIQDAYYCIRGAKIYCDTGYRNREWMKQYSFDRELAECAGLKVQISTKCALTPDSEISDADISGAKMIVLSNPKANLVIGDDTTYTKYGFTPAEGAKKHDITGLQMIQMLAHITQSNVPVIADYSIIMDADAMSGSDPTTAKASMMYRMLQALTLENVSAYYQTFAYATEAELSGEGAKPSDRGTLLDVNDHHFVNKSVYIYNMSAPAASPQRVPFLNQYYHSEVFGETAVTDGFGEVLLDIENENLYRETDGGHAALSTDISQAVAIRHIIGYGNKRAFNTKGTMRILEIEPCNSFDLSATGNDGVLWITQNKKEEKLIDQSETKITLTKMTTAEFIGKVEDLNSLYDMIYIGENTGLMMYTDHASGETRYNDSSMNGLIYCNVGDYIFGQPVMAGLMADDYTGNYLKGRSYVRVSGETSRYRYSGNDITEDKLNALKDYVAAGYPVVVANDFIKTQTTENEKIVSVNADKIDNASYMYEFMNAVKDKKNVFRLENLSSALFNWYLNLSKPGVFLPPDSAASKSVNNSYVIQQSVYDGLYHTEYEFELVNNGAADSNSTFDCQLFVDINADGKFSATTEQLTNFVVNNGDGSEAPKADGKYQLKTGVRYYGNCSLSEAYTGALPWQLKVTQNGNEARRMVTKGFYEIRNTKEKIKVLQINTSGTSTWNMEVTSKAEGIFKDRLNSDFVPFNVDITTITSDEYNGKGTNQEEYLTFLESYDMLVLGFGDCYREGNSTAMSAIQEYIERGRSVLFTHDTTSFINAPLSKFTANDHPQYTDLRNGGNGYASATYWGYEFNSKIRNLVGMDRYGILGNANEKEKAYTPKNQRKTSVRDVQGFTYSTLNRYRYTGNDGEGNAFPTQTNLKGIDTGNLQYDNEFVTQVNTGQITTYPYKLDEKFHVAKTHGQYYQLDLTADDDGDGESDIVVWYCISDSSSVDDSKDGYAMSPNDVRNNYYIYNKGNITYSGVGHSAVMKEVDGKYVANGSEEEIKLFINTLVAAYRSGLHAPKVTIYENYKTSSRKIDNIYISYDSQLKAMENQGRLDATEDLYFSARSVSLIQSTINTTQNMTAKLYYENPNGGETIPYEGETIRVSELSMDQNLWYYDTTTLTEAAGLATNIQNGVVYKTKVSTAALAPDENQVRLFVVVTQTLTNSKTNKVTTAVGDDTASMVRVQMFNLD